MADENPAVATVDPPQTAEEAIAAPAQPAPTAVEQAVAPTEEAVKDVKAAVEHQDIGTLVTAGEGVSNLVPVVGNVIKETKAGWKTTEFWAGIAAAVQAVATDLPQTDKVALIALAGVYAVARGIAKNGIPDVPKQV